MANKNYTDSMGVRIPATSTSGWTAIGTAYYQYYAGGGIDANTKLMLHMDGENNGTTFTDSSASAHSVTATGAVTQTANKHFGTASGLFDGTNDYLSVPNSSDFSFGTGDFTIDFWMSCSSFPAQAIVACQYNDGSNFFSIQHRDSTGLFLFAQINDAGGVTLSQGSRTITTSGWNHIAAVRYNGRFDLYINGTSVANTTNSNTMPSLTGNFLIGHNLYDNYLSYFAGGIDEFRVSKVARWTANFTVSPVPYT